MLKKYLPSKSLNSTLTIIENLRSKGTSRQGGCKLNRDCESSADCGNCDGRKLECKDLGRDWLGMKRCVLVESGVIPGGVPKRGYSNQLF
ncbi:Hypothetical predicted protein [Paramuricea clavata]|uniref:Uncharacterized protein n=1 Tax=Paramuricea clavata TaxID=317549 RepID=A0A6S7HHJ8_PARCT|nr:Hypothetical predicted protein [Paramuricea clavata]